MYRERKIAVIIPALNEEISLPFVLTDIPHYVDRIIICDNGSTDTTPLIVQRFERQDTRILGCKEERKGYGSACLKAIKQLCDEDIVVFLDADFCDFPDLLHCLLDPIVLDSHDLVISNRYNPLLQYGALTLPQKIGTKLAGFLIWLLWGFRYKDMGPFRAITLQKLLQLGMQDKGYGWTIEMQIRALQEGLNICQIDVPYRKRMGGKSKISGTVKGVALAGSKIIFQVFYHKLTSLLRK
jgi:hypothetical protein